MEKIYKAKPVCFGISIGFVKKYRRKELKIKQYNILPEDINDEIIRFDKAVTKSLNQINEIKNQINEQIGENYSKIFEAHLLMLQDRFFIDEIIKRIKNEQINCEYILDDALQIINENFKNLENEISRQRASDIYDVGRRVLQNLSDSFDDVEFENDKSDIILVAEELLPSDTLHFAHKNIKGLITERGGRTSHTSILARALKVPCLIEASDFFSKVIDGEIIILDAVSGNIIQQPEDETISSYIVKRDLFFESEKKILEESLKECFTKDNIRLNFFSNIEIPEEIDDVIKFGAEGIGLFRTEFIFLDKVRLPSENEQFIIYRDIVKKIPENQTVVIRTFDIGGDKIILSTNSIPESNPFLGLRAIRYCLENRAMFKTQLRAILRASAYGKTEILIPMVAFVSEILKTKELIKEIKYELDEEGIEYDKNIKVGIMVEIPGAVIILEKLLKHADFISIGTNDLIQYTLAVDRTNDKVNHLFQRMHPAVLELIHKTISICNNSGKPVTVCGDMAEIPITAILLLGMGLKNFSMTSNAIPDTKVILSNITFEQAKTFFNDIKLLSDSNEIRNYIIKHIKPLVTESIPSFKDADIWVI
ncbi:phosphoenolpyruvate--protein phosphotransferase [Candidatus Dependentiae bacterium]|nr:phosphoenolpyruvate--protein phosphotransferase [Candidatus Dependentiae bacterium]